MVNVPSKSPIEDLLTDGDEVVTTVFDLGETKIQRSIKGDLCIITASGLYTKKTGKELERLCLACTTNLGLEFTNITPNPGTQKRFDSTIVGMLRTISDKFKARKKQLLLCMPPSDLVDLLKLTGVYDGYTIVDKTSGVVLAGKSATASPSPEQGATSSSTTNAAPINRRIVTLNQSLKRTVTLEKGLESAEKCVKHFLPQTPPVRDGWEFAFSYRSSERVGGDFFDFLSLSDSQLGILIGDVSGHGLDAAILMGITKKVINLRAKDSPQPAPRDVLIKANEDLSSDFNKYTFVTVLYATLNLATGDLLIARAGHEMPILCTPDQQPRVIASGGTPIGLASTRIFSAALAQTQTRIERGSFLLLFTDGLSECWSQRGESFGRQRLLYALGKLKSDQNCQQALADILGQVAAFAGERPQEDDMTAVLLKRL